MLAVLFNLGLLVACINLTSVNHILYINHPRLNNSISNPKDNRCNWDDAINKGHSLSFSFHAHVDGSGMVDAP